MRPQPAFRHSEAGARYPSAMDDARPTSPTLNPDAAVLAALAQAAQALAAGPTLAAGIEAACALFGPTAGCRTLAVLPASAMASMQQPGRESVIDAGRDAQEWPIVVAGDCRGLLRWTADAAGAEARQRALQAFAGLLALRLPAEPPTPDDEPVEAMLARTRADELTRANRVLRRSMLNLVTLQDLPDFLRAMLREANSIGGARMAAIFRYDEAAGTLQMACSVTEGEDDCIDHDPAFALWREPVPAEIAGPWVERLRSEELVWFRPESVSHALAVPASVAWHAERGHRLILDIPLIAGGRLLGLFGQCFTTDAWPSAEQIEHARVLAQHASVALQIADLADDARLLALAEQRSVDEYRRAQNLRRHAEELEATNRTLQTTLDVLATETRVERALGKVLMVLAERLGARSAALWLRESTGAYRVHLVYGDGRVVSASDTEDPITAEWPLGRDLRWKEHIHQRRPLAYDAEAITERDPEMRALFARLGVRSLVGVPLILGDAAIGTFTARFTEVRSFGDDQLQLMQALAHQATLALRLRELSERSALESRQTAVLAERNRIGREIHDGVAQSFTGLLMQIEAMQASMTGAPDARLATFFDTLRDLARFGLGETRRAVLALQPMQGAAGGLVGALRQLAKRSAVPGRLRCRVEVRGEPPRLTAAVEHELFRIATEAVSNAVRHGEPSQVVIAFGNGRRGICLAVRDNGRGMDAGAGAQPGQGFGLDNMRERAAAIGAHLTLVSSPGRGTRVRVCLSPCATRIATPTAPLP